MSGFFRYFRLQLKRSIRICPVIICFTLVLSFCLITMLGALINEDASDEKNVRIRVGLVGNIEETHLGIGITMVQEIDTSKYYVEFVPLNEDEAKEQLDRGNLLGYIMVPDDFVDSIVHGENKHLTFISQASSSGLGPMLVKEIITIISDILTESQNGIYGMDALAKKHNKRYSEIRDAKEDLNLIYFDSIFGREESYEINTIGTGKGMGFADYYFCAFSLVLMLLWGMVCIPLLTKNSLELERLMWSQGRGSVLQTVAEYIPFLIITLVNVAIMLIGAGHAIPAVEGMVFTEIFTGAKGVLYMLPALMLITSMQFLLYEICNGVVTTVLVQMFAALGLSFISGFFYPAGSLPEVVQSVAAYTPTGAAFGYLSDIFAEGRPALSLITVLAYSVVLMAASAFVRSYKIRRTQL